MRQFARDADNAKSLTAWRIIEETARRGERGMKIGRDESECVRACRYRCVCECRYVAAEDERRRLARVGSAILHRKSLAPGQGRVSLRIGIRCSTPGYQQKCFPHSASHAFTPPPFRPHSRLFTCITFAEDMRETSTCRCAFKVASQKPRAIGRGLRRIWFCANLVLFFRNKNQTTY